MKIYTKTGDTGQTSLLGGKRVDKNCIEMQAIGEVDELNSFLGIVISQLTDNFKNEKIYLQKIQNTLFDLGANLAAVQTKLIKIPKISKNDITSLEKQIDKLDNKLSKLTQFILPGGSVSASLSFQARAICRRAERVIVDLGKSNKINNDILKYINRLSDYLFTLARYLNKEEGVEETTWKK